MLQLNSMQKHPKRASGKQTPNHEEPKQIQQSYELIDSTSDTLCEEGIGDVFTPDFSQYNLQTKLNQSSRNFEINSYNQL